MISAWFFQGVWVLQILERGSFVEWTLGLVTYKGFVFVIYQRKKGNQRLLGNNHQGEACAFLIGNY